jgi:hypothetical protein
LSREIRPVAALAEDLDRGARAERNAELLDLESIDLGARLLIADAAQSPPKPARCSRRSRGLDLDEPHATRPDRYPQAGESTVIGPAQPTSSL